MNDLRPKILDFTSTYGEIDILANSNLQKEFTSLYHSVTGKVISCSACSKQVGPALNLLKKMLILDQPIYQYSKVEMKYILKSKIRIHVKCLGIVLTPYNCTDNNAKALLGESPDRISLFDKFPDNWEAESKEFYGKLVRKNSTVIVKTTDTAMVVSTIEENGSPVGTDIQESSTPLQPTTSLPKKRGRKPKSKR